MGTLSGHKAAKVQRGIRGHPLHSRAESAPFIPRGSTLGVTKLLRPPRPSTTGDDPLPCTSRFHRERIPFSTSLFPPAGIYGFSSRYDYPIHVLARKLEKLSKRFLSSRSKRRAKHWIAVKDNKFGCGGGGGYEVHEAEEAQEEGRQCGWSKVTASSALFASST